MAAYRWVYMYDFVTCGMTAYDWDQLRAQCSYRVWATFTLYLIYMMHSVTLICCRHLSRRVSRTVLSERWKTVLFELDHDEHV